MTVNIKLDGVHGAPKPGDIGAPAFPPDDILEIMADAMLEPNLGKASTSGNIVRKDVLRRSLVAADYYGWRLVKKDLSNVG